MKFDTSQFKGEIRMLTKSTLKRVVILGVLSLCLLGTTTVWAEWVTNAEFPLIGDPQAKKGGDFTYAIMSYPGTFRIYGPEAGTSLHLLMTNLVYQTLLDLHPTTLDFIPALAEAWEIQADKKTFRFRLNPNARWADGQPVTSEDVVFSWEFVTDPNTQEPYSGEMFKTRFDKPTIIDERTVQVVSKEPHWNNFLYFANSLPILPAHSYRGKDYIKDLNWDLPNGSGPYQLAKYNKGNTIVFQRRNDFWGKDLRSQQGLYNFDRITFLVVRDQNLMFEKFKKGELDYYYANIAREWVEQTNFDKVQQGWIQKRKIYTFYPSGLFGIALNTRRAPLDDVRVRKALAYLYNRPVFMEKLFFNEYELMNSYFPGSIYANPNNESMEYNPAQAQTLLAEAGWQARDAQGLLVHAGQPLSFTVLYSQKSLERFLTIYQADLLKAGIELKLQIMDWTAMLKLVDERNFDMVVQGWTGELFPNPESAFHSNIADVTASNNITGVKNPQIDAILDKYPTMFDLNERIAAIREVDGVLANEHHYILNWYGPFYRLLYWNKFDMPAWYLSKTGDSDSMLALWWYDAKKDKILQDAIKNKTALPVGETIVDYWGVKKGQP
jgi:microcin C transport system substrate-binding protein